MATKKPTQKELEEKLKNLTAQLDQERKERKDLEGKLSQQPPLFSFELVTKHINELLEKANLPFLAKKTEKRVKKVLPRPTPVSHEILEESLSDDLGTYRSKLKDYTIEQLEDIFLQIDREEFPERFTALIEELKTRQ